MPRLQTVLQSALSVYLCQTQSAYFIRPTFRMDMKLQYFELKHYSCDRPHFYTELKHYKIKQFWDSVKLSYSHYDKQSLYVFQQLTEKNSFKLISAAWAQMSNLSKNVLHALPLFYIATIVHCPDVFLYCKMKCLLLNDASDVCWGGKSSDGPLRSKWLT